MQCTVMPPTLYEAKPVGAPRTHLVSTSVSCFQISDTCCLIASIRKDLPVPPTPLMKVCSGLKLLQGHSLFHALVDGKDDGLPS